jgi:hypothetical protein
MRNIVVFPDPFAPTRATHSPGEMLSVMPRNASRIPNRFSMFSNWTLKPVDMGGLTGVTWPKNSSAK